MTKLANRFRNVASALLIALCAGGAEAASYAGTQFEIEMVVFSRDNGMSQSRETWPAAPLLQYGERWVDFQTPSALDPALPALQPAPNQLDNKVAALRRASGYQVLFHKTWRQVLVQEHRAPEVLISGGPVFGDHHALEGSVTLSVSRYLHINTNLWLSEFDGAMPTGALSGDNTVPSGILVPQRPVAKPLPQPGDEPMGLSANDGFGFSNTESANNGSYSTSADSAEFFAGDAPAVAARTFAKNVAVLNEARRLRSGELHYIDHPKLGVLIEIRKVTPEEPDPESELEEDMDLPAN
ncbi:CsiV family protein [uncultured Microbulbifer sp.]|uniref:CsiV family protein n=1 Tax=uncultured Microbulbifer sp. TaxID=348147 RepID=UPI0025E37DAB|nr:CsiV family protein [uncultured Microbulbifer sp.]